MADVAPLNSLGEVEALAALLRCCGSTRWAEQMAAQRPFADFDTLLDTARTVWKNLVHVDWLEAFAAHPKIGDLGSLRAKFAHTAAWSEQEQAGVATTTESTLQALAARNRAYEEKFGYIFIVCATGKSADEMLALLQQRLGNSANDELCIAAAEQEKITGLRLQRLCS